MKKMLALSLAFATIQLMSCASTTSLSISEKVGSGKKVTASMTNTNFLALSPTTSLQQIEASLTSQCGGKITGVTLQSHVRAVPYFNIENFEASAYCVGGSSF